MEAIAGLHEVSAERQWRRDHTTLSTHEDDCGGKQRKGNGSPHIGFFARSATNLFHLASQVSMAANFSLCIRALYLEEKNLGQSREELNIGEGAKGKQLPTPMRSMMYQRHGGKIIEPQPQNKI